MMRLLSPLPSPQKAEAGFSMTEVLVAVVIVSLGLLGMGALQSTGLAMNNSSLMRMKATLKTYELADRMRANQRAFDPAITGYLTTVSVVNCTVGVSGSLASDCSSAGSSCTTQQIAQNDLCEWKTDLSLQLPFGVGTVCVDSTPDDGTPTSPQCDGIGPISGGVSSIYAIKVWWNDDKSGNLKRFVTTVRP